jgi:hypothetical protein
MFKVFEFCLPTKSTTVPTGSDWLHEIKYDGYRLRLERDGDRVRLIARGGHGWTHAISLDRGSRPQGPADAVRARRQGRPPVASELSKAVDRLFAPFPLDEANKALRAAPSMNARAP